MKVKLLTCGHRAGKLGECRFKPGSLGPRVPALAGPAPGALPGHDGDAAAALPYRV